jgi:hypothetical protein
MLKRETRAKLLGLVKAGHDIDSGCAALNLSPKSIRADEKLMAEVAEAFRIGTAKLRARLSQSALDNNDTEILGQMLEAREAEQAKMAGSLDEMVDKWSDTQLDLMTLLTEKQWPDEQVRNARDALVRPAADLEEMRRELLAEAQRHVEAMEPLPQRVRPVHEAPLLDETIPLPASRAPARVMRPRAPVVEVLPPDRYAGVYEPAERARDRWAGTPWDRR